ncbi:hypothetical protein RIF29_26607 [Crotalaria pallida]|uniref:TF-B3 domain-containing protein n=1 Tax=Crotalaria pallida TaxID=3830 RepID=A0AAN9ENV2_CROPI
MSPCSTPGLSFDNVIIMDESEEFKGTDVYDCIFKDLDGTQLLHIFSNIITKSQIRGIQTMGKRNEPEKWYIKWNQTKNNYCAFGEGWYGYVQANKLKVDDMVDFYLNKKTDLWIVAYL